MIRLAIVVVALLLARSAAAGCPDGEYVVRGEPLLSSAGGAFAIDVVTIAGGTIAIASGCPAVRASFRSTSRGTVVRASWPACGSTNGVRLRAVVNKPCRAMRSWLVTRRPRAVRRFVAIRGPCRPGKPCHACGRNADCGPATYCAKTPGDCTGTGVCTPRPNACPLSIVAVCGCDGTTYAGPCEAAAASTNVAHVGACVAASCGGVSGIPCDAGAVCELPAGRCGAADLQGQCVPLPGACPTIYDPVCGCDARSYPNDCDRLAARVQKAHDGVCAAVECADACDCARTKSFPAPCPLACATCGNYWTCDGGTCAAHCGPIPQPAPVCESKVCGGIAGTSCAAGDFCDLPPGQCDAADAQGICTPLAETCLPDDRPVCGCDGTTYANDCERRTKGVPKAHDGQCGIACTTDCDCEKAVELPSWCGQLLCPACGCVWTCDGGTCALHVVSPVPPPACGTTGAS